MSALFVLLFNLTKIISSAFNTTLFSMAGSSGMSLFFMKTKAGVYWQIDSELKKSAGCMSRTQLPVLCLFSPLHMRTCIVLMLNWLH